MEGYIAIPAADCPTTEILPGVQGERDDVGRVEAVCISTGNEAVLQMRGLEQHSWGMTFIRFTTAS